MRLRRRFLKLDEAPPADAQPHHFVSAKRFLQASGVDSDADPAQLPVVLLPYPLACLLAIGAWRWLVLQARWHVALNRWNVKKDPRQHPRVVSDWPPADSACWGNIGKQLDVNAGGDAVLDYEFLKEAVRHIRSWAQSLGPGSVAQKEQMSRFVQVFEHWARMYLGMQPAVNEIQMKGCRGVKHDSVKMLHCIRLSAKLCGGADKLAEVCALAIELALPRHLSKAVEHFYEINPKQLIYVLQLI